MINPKDFYRKLDTLLSEIYQLKRGDILPTILTELIDFLGKELHIVNGYLYEEDDSKFNLIFSTDEVKVADFLPTSEKAINLIMQHGCYIFNEPEDLNESPLATMRGLTPAGFVVNDEEKHWIFIFGLEAGWERE